MANDEHVAVLARGAPSWNEWRADCDETPDLSRAGLRGLELSGFDLSRAGLRGADLRGTNFSGAKLSGAHLEGANFFKAVLDGADLFRTDNYRNRVAGWPLCYDRKVPHLGSSEVARN
jgi:uncharacterized protein YjbI with pentapeptide repeats